MFYQKKPIWQKIKNMIYDCQENYKQKQSYNQLRQKILNSIDSDGNPNEDYWIYWHHYKCNFIDVDPRCSEIISKEMLFPRLNKYYEWKVDKYS